MPDRLQLLTWNLGYAGLGAETDFLVEGGRRLRIEDPALARRWMSEIALFLASRPDDVLLLQEVGRPSWVNHRCDLWTTLRGQLPSRAHTYAHEVRLPLPFGYGNEMGCAILAAQASGGSFAMTRLPGHGRSHIRQYPALIYRLDHAGAPFTLIDAHLSAFDKGARLRVRQLAELMRLAALDFAAGRHVVIGADFNYELCPPPRPSTTDPKHMAWLHPFPRDALPDGWRIACDPSVPTFRSGDRPYVRGENYSGVIDGFIVSPNVEIVRVEGIGLEFEASDHNPVSLTVRAKVISRAAG